MFFIVNMHTPIFLCNVVRKTKVIFNFLNEMSHVSIHLVMQVDIFYKEILLTNICQESINLRNILILIL